MSLYEDKYSVVLDYWAKKLTKVSIVDEKHARTIAHDMLQDFMEEVEEFNSKMKDDLQSLNEDVEMYKDKMKDIFRVINSGGDVDVL